MAKAKTTRIGKTTVKGATDADKQAIAAAKAEVRAEDAGTTQVQKRGDQASEAQPTRAAKSKAAEKMFADADAAALRGFPPDLTTEQHENIVRRAATGL